MTNEALVDAFRAVLDAVMEERAARMNDEYREGAIWDAERAIDRLAAVLDAERCMASEVTE